MPKKKKKNKVLRKIILTLLILLILFIVLLFISGGEEENEGLKAEGSIQNLELPSPVEDEQIIRHTGYTLSYNEDAECASWVAYELTRSEVLSQAAERDDDFREDDAVLTGSASLEDYRKSGYDRGHLAPAADFKWSEEAMSDTFYMSNMTAQNPSFNRGIWADLEAVVRTNAYYSGSLYVVTGPVLTDGPYERIGENGVAVPKRFYKVLLSYCEDEVKAIAFILENENSDRRLESFATSVDEAEEITGLDFYPALPDEIENAVESSYDTSLWSFEIYLPDDAEYSSDDISYVAPQSSIDRIWQEIMSLVYDLKKDIFELTGTEDIARAVGLL